MLDDGSLWEGESRRTSGYMVEMHTPCPCGPQVEYHAPCLPLQIAVCGQVLKSLNGVFHVMVFKRHCEASHLDPCRCLDISIQATSQLLMTFTTIQIQYKGYEDVFSKPVLQ